MKELLLFVLISFLSFTLFSQSCLPEGIIFRTQEQIDNFQTDYPGCAEIEGDVSINWNEATNLNGLNVLTSIQGNLQINSTDSLTSLTGLDNLTYVGGSVILGTFGIDAMLGYVQCEGNSSLNSLTGLGNLTYIGGNLDIYCNEKLADLTGLGNLTTIEGDLNIGHAHTTWITGDVTSAGNQLITTLSGLENIGYIGGDLKIEGNSALTSLSGLNNEVIVGGDLSIKFNETLSTCEAQSICDYLSNPIGAVEIHSNAIGCNNPVEIANNCGFTLSCLPYGNYYFLNQIDIDEFQINYPMCGEINGDVNIYGSDINNLNGLSTISSIDGDLQIGTAILGINAALTSLSGLESITSIGGYLSVVYNDSLVNINGLENIEAGSITHLNVSNNHNLAICDVQSICDYLAAPNGVINIDDNAPGCNSQLEVEEACASSINEIGFINGLAITPNPFITSTTLSYDLKQPEKITLTVYDYLGKQVYQVEENQSQGQQELIWSAERYADGIYYYRLQVGDAVANGKLVKVR